MVNNKVKALIFGFIFSVLMSMLGFSGRCESISDKILRLHIIANSDSSEDQSLKLKLRDEIISKFGSELRVCSGLNEAKENAESKKGEIRNFALETLRKYGFDYDVKVEVTRMYFNIRRYEKVTLPAGIYDALRITIGEGKGKNWWCVMFPPMCLPAAEEKEELSSVLNSSEIDIVENESEYIMKFKLLEAFEEAKVFIEEKVCKKVGTYLKEAGEKISESYELKFKLGELISKFNFSE